MNVNGLSAKLLKKWIIAQKWMYLALNAKKKKAYLHQNFNNYHISNCITTQELYRVHGSGHIVSTADENTRTFPTLGTGELT